MLFYSSFFTFVSLFPSARTAKRRSSLGSAFIVPRIASRQAIRTPRSGGKERRKVVSNFQAQYRTTSDISRLFLIFCRSAKAERPQNATPPANDAAAAAEAGRRSASAIHRLHPVFESSASGGASTFSGLRHISRSGNAATAQNLKYGYSARKTISILTRFDPSPVSVSEVQTGRGNRNRIESPLTADGA